MISDGHGLGLEGYLAVAAAISTNFPDSNLRIVTNFWDLWHQNWGFSGAFYYNSTLRLISAKY